MPDMKRLVVMALALAWTSGIAAAEKTDPATLANALSDFFRIYLLKPEMRSPQDVVTIKEIPGGGYSGEISYWRSLKSRDPAEEICNAYRWLLFGRGVYGKGAPAAFEKFPSLEQLFLKFVDVENGTKLGKKRAEIVPTQKVVPYLRIGIFRSSLASKKSDWPAVRNDLDKGRCAEVGRNHLDVTWIEPAYVKPAP
jgi:hypothetical protein